MRMTINAPASGELMNKYTKDTYILIEDMAQNLYQWVSKHALIEKAPRKEGSYEVSDLDHINAEVDSLFQKYDNAILKFISPASPTCKIYGAVGYIGTTFQVMVAGEPGLETWLIL